MEHPVTALLVFTRPETLHQLKVALAHSRVASSTVRTCGEAALHLWRLDPPHLVFTDTQLEDAAWTDVLRLAARALAPVNVIVVSPVVDVGLYIQAIELGASDFLVPPFRPEEVGHVVRTTAANVLRRRRERNQTISVAG